MQMCTDVTVINMHIKDSDKISANTIDLWRNRVPTIMAVQLARLFTVLLSPVTVTSLQFQFQLPNLYYSHSCWLGPLSL